VLDEAGVALPDPESALDVDSPVAQTLRAHLRVIGAHPQSKVTTMSQDTERDALTEALGLLSALKGHVDPNDSSPDRAPFNNAWKVALAEAHNAAEQYVTSRTTRKRVAP